jgi:arsenate reductase (thioredoxin)
MAARMISYFVNLPIERLDRLSLEQQVRDLGTTAVTSKEVAMAESKKRVLILCTGNSARSQMGEGILHHDAGDRFDVFSAGTAFSSVNPLAIEAMREIGIDISSHRAKSVDEFLAQPFDYVITVCDNARESCPIFPGASKQIHSSFEDPAAAQGGKEARLAVFRRVRDQIRERLANFVKHGD